MNYEAALISERSGSVQPGSSVQVEPPVVPLTEPQKELLSAIVERRRKYMPHRCANEVRAYTLQEALVAGLVRIARAEGVPT